jgi:hypothetical protein
VLERGELEGSCIVLGSFKVHSPDALALLRTADSLVVPISGSVVKISVMSQFDPERTKTNSLVKYLKAAESSLV